MGCPFLRTRNTTVLAPSVPVSTMCHSPRRLVEAGAGLERYRRLTLGCEAHGPFENETELSTWMVVLCSSRYSGSRDETHDDFEIGRVSDIDSMQLRESTTSRPGLPAGHYRETDGHESDQDCRVSTSHCRSS